MKLKILMGVLLLFGFGVAAAGHLLFPPAHSAVVQKPHVSDRAKGDPALGPYAVECDFGRLLAGSEYKKEIILRNDGASAIVLREIVPSCGCTLASIAPTEIPPGGESKVVVTYRPPNAAVIDEKNIRIAFQGTEPREYTVMVRAEVWPEVSVLPNRLLIRRTNSTDGAAVARVYNFGSDPWKGLELRSVQGVTVPRQLSELPGGDLPDGAIQGFEVQVDINKESVAMSEAAFDIVAILPQGLEGELRAELRADIERAETARIVPSHLVVGASASLKRSVVVLLPDEFQERHRECAFTAARDGNAIPAQWTPLENRGWRVELDLNSIAKAAVNRREDEIVMLTCGDEAIADIRVHVSLD